eukprot:scaffold31550_cov60-Phaeocystis_antarctica.AAC.4
MAMRSPKQGCGYTACKQCRMKTPSASAGSLKLASCTAHPCWRALRLAHARISASSTWIVARSTI